ncbi:MAG: hypothetical protein R2847_09200 [Bacteroidia bacterium]
MIRVPFEITGHLASSVRVLKQEDLCGHAFRHSECGIFNGLGTKGVMLSPYLSRHFVNHLLKKEKLMPEIDIAQYDDLL